VTRKHVPGHMKSRLFTARQPEEAKATIRSMTNRTILTVLFFMGVAGCAKQLQWNEEVKLQNGEVVVVTRTAKAKPFGEIGGPGGWENKGMTLMINTPIEPNNPPIWAERLVPVLFDRDPASNEWIVVATVITCTDWYDLGRPALPYAEFRTKNGQWSKQELSRELIGRDGNLFTSIHSTGESDHTLVEKDQLKVDPSISPQYKRIVPEWKSNC